MNKRLIFLAICIVLLGLFTGFSKYVKRGGLKQTDFNTTVRLQDKIPARFDQVMDDGAVLADGIVSSALVLGITALMVFDWKKRKLRPAALLIPIAFFLLGISEIYGKNILPHPGPPFFMVKHPTTIFPKFTIVQPYSYPSGHAARSTFLGIVVGMILWQRWKKQQRNAFLMLSVVFGYIAFVWISRIYLGHHWFSDIVGGILIGTAFGSLAIAFLVPDNGKK